MGGRSPARMEDRESKMEFAVQTPPVLSEQNRFSKALVEPPGTVLIFQESWAERARKIPVAIWFKWFPIARPFCAASLFLCVISAFDVFRRGLVRLASPDDETPAMFPARLGR